jgi:hypothetical protein
VASVRPRSVAFFQEKKKKKKKQSFFDNQLPGASAFVTSSVGLLPPPREAEEGRMTVSCLPEIVVFDEDGGGCMGGFGEMQAFFDLEPDDRLAISVAGVGNVITDEQVEYWVRVSRGQTIIFDIAARYSDFRDLQAILERSQRRKKNCRLPSKVVIVF